jgi:hypothetical protein
MSILAAKGCNLMGLYCAGNRQIRIETGGDKKMLKTGGSEAGGSNQVISVRQTQKNPHKAGFFVFGGRNGMNMGTGR